MEVLLVATPYVHARIALLSYHSPFHFNPMYVPRLLSVVYPLPGSGFCPKCRHVPRDPVGTVGDPVSTRLITRLKSPSRVL